MNDVPYRVPPSTPILSGPTRTQSSPSPYLKGSAFITRSASSTVPSGLIRIVTFTRTGRRPSDFSC